jgi:hypothetical protein
MFFIGGKKRRIHEFFQGIIRIPALRVSSDLNLKQPVFLNRGNPANNPDSRILLGKTKNRKKQKTVKEKHSAHKAPFFLNITWQQEICLYQKNPA